MSTSPFDLRSLKKQISSAQFVLSDDTNVVKSQQPTVCEYIVDILATKLGIKHAFGCPGDFAFAFDDAIENSPSMEFVLTTNELNASYAADAYARIHGCSVLTTTYGVGELSAINGVMGSKAESVGAVFHLVGEPGLRLQHTGRVVHHTLGDPLKPDDTPFMKVSEQSCCVSLRVLDPGSLPRELDTAIEVALRARQPCYILVPKDIGVMRIPQNSLERYTSMFQKPLSRLTIKSACHAESVESELVAGVHAIIQRISKAKKIGILVSYMVNRLGLESKTIRLIEALGCPFFTTTMDKGTLNETHPQFGGMYKGKLSFPSVLECLETADCVLDIGGILFDDLSSGWGTASLLKERMVSIDAKNAAICLGDASERCVQNLRASYHGCFLGDVLDALIEHESLPSFPSSGPIALPSAWPALDSLDEEQGIMYSSIGTVLQNFLTKDDIFVVEVGTISGLLSNIHLPEGCTYISQQLWGSIGYATPATLGACLAAPERRVVFVSGDGAHLMTANEIGTNGRYGAKPMMIVMNNGVYGVEEFLEKNQQRSYNTLTGWEYADAARAMLGSAASDWIIEKVTTVKSLVIALNKARSEDRACYIEARMTEILLDPMSTVDLGVMYFDQPPHET